MIRSRKGIEMMRNLIKVAYCAMKLHAIIDRLEQ